MKIIIFSDGKYGERAIKVVQKKYPDAEFILVKEENPTMFLDEVELDDKVENAIESADLLILYVRHPDVVAEICAYEKSTILPIHFGEGFFNQVKSFNPKVVQPVSMCNALPDTGIVEIDEFFKNFGSPVYNIEIDGSDNKLPKIKHISLSTESPCGATINTLDQIQGKEITPEVLNNFALAVRQECREPVSVIFSREFSETAGATHLLKLFQAIEEQDKDVLRNVPELKVYVEKMRESYSET